MGISLRFSKLVELYIQVCVNHFIAVLSIYQPEVQVLDSKFLTR